MKFKIFTGSNILYENDKIQIHQSRYSKELYDQNFIKVKKNIDQNYLNELEAQCTSKSENKCLLFKFDNHFTESDILIKNMLKKKYLMSNLEVYSISEKKILNFSHEKFEEKNILKICEKNINDFFCLKYFQDSQYGEVFAKENNLFLKELISEEKMDIYVSKVDNKMVGFISIIKGKLNNEIYELYVLPEYRNQGFAKYMLYYALGNSPKDTIVIADKNDTPKYIYRKIGFELENEWIELQKEII